MTLIDDRPRHRTRRGRVETPREFVGRLHREHPDDDADQLRERCKAHVYELTAFNDDAIERVTMALIDAALRPIIKQLIEPQPRSTSQERQQQRRTIKAAMGQAFDQHVEQRAALKLLEYVTLFDKPLGDCTGADCKKLSVRDRDFFGEIAKRISPAEHVRNHLTEGELQAIHRTCRLA